MEALRVTGLRGSAEEVAVVEGIVKVEIREVASDTFTNVCELFDLVKWCFLKIRLRNPERKQTGTVEIWVMYSFHEYEEWCNGSRYDCNQMMIGREEKDVVVWNKAGSVDLWWNASKGVPELLKHSRKPLCPIYKFWFMAAGLIGSIWWRYFQGNASCDAPSTVNFDLKLEMASSENCFVSLQDMIQFVEFI